MRKMADSFPAQRTATQVQLLLVDDDVALGELVCEYAAYEGYVVTTADTGELGLRIMARKAFALVILDVMLPGIDGFEVLELIESSAMPVVIFVTAFDQYAMRAFDAHAVDYLLKPFSAERLDRAL